MSTDDRSKIKLQLTKEEQKLDTERKKRNAAMNECRKQERRVEKLRKALLETYK